MGQHDVKGNLTDEQRDAVDRALATVASVPKSTWVRTIAFFICLANAVLAIFGVPGVIPEDDGFAQLVYSVISAGLVVVTGIWTWWRNNSFTDVARTADAMGTLMDNGLSFYKSYQALKGAYRDAQKAAADKQAAKDAKKADKAASSPETANPADEVELPKN